VASPKEAFSSVNGGRGHFLSTLGCSRNLLKLEKN
jgi:hypothetical protein